MARLLRTTFRGVATADVFSEHDSETGERSRNLYFKKTRIYELLGVQDLSSCTFACGFRVGTIDILASIRSVDTRGHCC